MTSEKLPRDSGVAQAPRGLTLIEILVVIGVCGVLCSIVLPTLGPSLQLAKNLKCEDNLQNLALEARAWSSDHKDSPPLDGSSFTHNECPANWTGEDSYAYLPQTSDVLSFPRNWLVVEPWALRLAQDERQWHPKSPERCAWANRVFCDGHVRRVP